MISTNTLKPPELTNTVLILDKSSTKGTKQLALSTNELTPFNRTTQSIVIATSLLKRCCWMLNWSDEKCHLRKQRLWCSFWQLKLRAWRMGSLGKFVVFGTTAWHCQWMFLWLETRLEECHLSPALFNSSNCGAVQQTLHWWPGTSFWE